MLVMPKSISRIPPEVLISIAYRLDKFSLLMMLQVSKDVYTVLYPLLWIDIVKKHWLHTAFPAKDALAYHTLPRLKSSLFNIRSLEWWDSAVHMTRISDLNPAMFSPPRNNLPNFSRLLQFTPLLTSLSLVASSFGPATRSVLKTIVGLQHLTTLELCFVNQRACSAICIDDYFHLFSKLNEMRLSGNWYYFRRDNKSMKSLAVESKREWSMKQLCLRTSDITITKFCPKLIDIVLSGNFSRASSTSILPITICSNLETLELRHCIYNGRMDDIHLALPSLQSLRSLAMCVDSMEQILCLCPTPDGTRLPLPLLQHLRILDTSLSIDILNRTPFTRALRIILVSRPRLLSLSVQGCSVSAGLLFSPSGSTACQNAFWVCKDLQSLQIQLADVNRSCYPLRERQAVSRLVYQQLAQLPCLEVLSVHSTNIDIGIGSGVLALAESFSSSPSTHMTSSAEHDYTITMPSLQKLHSLSLFDRSFSLWTEHHLRLILSLFPKLNNLTLTRPLKVPGENVSKWLQEVHPTDIKFSTGSNIVSDYCGTNTHHYLVGT